MPMLIYIYDAGDDSGPVELQQKLGFGKLHQMEGLWGATILRRGFRWDLGETFLRPVTHCYPLSGVKWDIVACQVDISLTPSVSLK